ncbi:hypothetical protein MHTCC0001_32540 [Flavobacteriaceae bacterium MHTCC 0001]
MNYENDEKQREYNALTLLKEQCEYLIHKKIKPYKLWKMIRPLEEMFDFPHWLGELYDVLDWCEPHTPVDGPMIQEAKQRITAINQLIRSMERGLK